VQSNVETNCDVWMRNKAHVCKYNFIDKVMLKYMAKENFEVTSKLTENRDNNVKPQVRFVKWASSIKKS
jgi:hypothetical protein